MKTTLHWKSFLGGALLAAVLFFAIGAGAQNKGAVEYKVVQGLVIGSEVNLDRMINQQIDEGWELVTVLPSKDVYGFALMKRPKP